MDRRSDTSTAPLALVWVLAGVAACAAAPAVLIGAALGEFGLRRRRLRSTWALTACIPAVAAGVVILPDAFPRLAASVDAALASDAGALTVLAAALPMWGLLVLPSAAAWCIWRAGRDRLRGGAAADALALHRGPVDVLRQRRRNARELQAGAYTPRGVLLGLDEFGDVLRLPLLRAHATIVGGSDTGKTNSAAVLLEGHVAAGFGFIALDGKGGRDLPRAAVALARTYQRPVALWSVRPYGDVVLDALRLPWSVTGDGDPTEVKDRIAATEEQTEPYYAALADRGLLAATQALTQLDGDVRLDELARLMDSDAALQAALREADPERFASELAWLAALTEKERSALRGMATRLRTMLASGGEWLLPHPHGRQLSLVRAVSEGWLVVFTLPQGTYPKLIPHVARYALQAINSVCTRIEGQGREARSVVFVDELSAFDGDQLAATYERARSAGVRVVVATQSLSNFTSAGGDKLLDAALDNSELVLVHRQAVPDAAEKLAGVGGTEETWEHTHKAQGAGLGGQLQTDLGLDESGERNRRLSDRFRAHPNTIKQLGRGEAVVIARRPVFAVRRVRIRAGLTATAPARTRASSDQPDHHDPQED